MLLVVPAQNALQLVAPLRCGIYCRISDDDSRDEVGVKRQERNCRAVVDRIAGAVAGVYVDNDLSAAPGSKPRQEFGRLCRDLAAGTLDVVVVQNQDRISRDHVEVELFMRRLRELGHSHFWTASAGQIGIKTTNERLGYRVKGLFDNAYSEYISEKIVEFKAERALNGLPEGGGFRAFGWSCHTPRKKLASCVIPGCGHDLGLSLIPQEAELLRQAADRLLDGATLADTHTWVCGQGVPTVSGAPWAPGPLKKMLLAPRIVGRRVHAGGGEVAAKWPAILDESIWEQLQAELSERYRPQARRRSHRLSGVPVCGLCGYRLEAAMVTRGGHRRPEYRCRPSTPSRPAGCGRVTVSRGDLLEDQVLNMVGGWLDDPDLAADVTAVLLGDQTGDVEALEAQAAAYETELAQLAGDRRAMGWELFEYEAQRRPVKGLLDEVRAKLSEARRRSARSVAGAVTAAELAALWPGMGDEARREVVSLLAVVAVNPATPGPAWDPDRIQVRPAWEA